MTDGDTSSGNLPKRHVFGLNKNIKGKTTTNVETPSYKSKIPVRDYKGNNGIYSLTTTQKMSDGSSESNVSIIDTENERKHLSWDSGHNEDIAAGWFTDDAKMNMNCQTSWNSDLAKKDPNYLDTSDSGEVNSDAPDSKILSWHTLSIMTLQNMIIDQSEKIKQLEMNCHLQEILIKNQKDDIDLYQERIDQLEIEAKDDREEKKIIKERLETVENLIRIPQIDEEKLSFKMNSLENEVKVNKDGRLHIVEKIEVLERIIDDHKEEMDLLLERIDDSMKSNSREMDYLSARADTLEEFAAQHKVERSIYNQKLDHIEGIMKNLSKDALELVSERIDNLVIAFEKNKSEKESLLQRIEDEIELFLERMANLELALHKAEKSGERIERNPYEEDQSVPTNGNEAISDLHTKVIDTYTDTEAALNVIHNMLHKDKLTKII